VLQDGDGVNREIRRRKHLGQPVFFASQVDYERQVSRLYRTQLLVVMIERQFEALLPGSPPESSVVFT
jgi:hypothetical protein